MMLRQIRNRTSGFSRTFRILIPLALIAIVCVYTSWDIRGIPQEVVEQHVVKQSQGVYGITKKVPSVNLVIAQTVSEDTSWVKDLKNPNFNVINYFADNTTAVHHTQRNKGHEAMIYHQYFYDYYDNLPDISILIHSQKESWHIDTLLGQSMIYSLNHLDLREVQRREFLNLKVTWGFGCSDGMINTTKVNEERENKPEQKEMQDSFRANFNLYDIPEILATPCCSQIAVTKELIRAVPREQYNHHIQWLLRTDLDDSLSGRVWEHMWQYLFLHKAIDCPIEHKAFCRLYHICFGGREAYEEFLELNQGRESLERELKKLAETMAARREMAAEEEEKKEDDDKDKAATKKAVDLTKKDDEKMEKWLRNELDRVNEVIRVRREVAIVRGSIEVNRIAEDEDEEVHFEDTMAEMSLQA